MIHDVNITAILDTNVIYPIIKRDILFWFAHYELYTVKWSNHIFDEWKNLMLRKGVDEREAFKRVNVANKAFPNALVRNYHNLIKTVNLPDPNDRHVLAAAIKSHAHVIVTENLKDFPDEVLSEYGLKAISADKFLTKLIEIEPVIAVDAFRDMITTKNNPRVRELELLAILRRNGLVNSAGYLSDLLDKV